MVEIEGIDSDEKLYKWLKEQPENYSAFIAHRRSMRMLPKVWADVIGDHYAVDSSYSPIVAILRANLISGLKGNSRNFEDEKHFRIAAQNAREILISELDKYEKSFGSFINLSGAGYTADAITVSACDNVLANAYYPYEDISELMDWRALQSDVFMLASNEMLDGSPLWGDVMPPLFIEWDRVKAALKADSVNWKFWVKWYEAVLNGEPLNGVMLERIALIPSEDWEKGPAHVNEIIAGIETEFELKAKIAELEGKLLQISSSGRGIGDNQGPPMVDKPVAKEVMIIWEPLQELKQEIDQKSPSRNRLLEIGKRIGEFAVAILKWVANKADLAVNTAIKVGSTAAVGLAVVRLSTDAEPVASMLSEISELAVKLAGYFP